MKKCAWGNLILYSLHWNVTQCFHSLANRKGNTLLCPFSHSSPWCEFLCLFKTLHRFHWFVDQIRLQDWWVKLPGCSVAPQQNILQKLRNHSTQMQISVESCYVRYRRKIAPKPSLIIIVPTKCKRTHLSNWTAMGEDKCKSQGLSWLIFNPTAA